MSNAVAARKDERARRKAERMMEKQREAAEHDLPRSMRPSPITKTITVIVLVVALIYFLFPIYWAIIASTKTPSQLTSSNGLWFAVGLDQIPDAIATNYSKLMGWTRGQFWRWVLNSLIYSGVSALIGTIISVMAGYATAKFNFRGKAIAIGVVMGCMLMPVALLTIPQYSIFHALHLTNTMLAIIIPCCVSPFGFFLGRVYAQTSVPNELLEAARIDGANRWQTLWRVTIPNVMPSITICMFLSLTNGFKLFDQNLALTAGRPFQQLGNGETIKTTEMLALNIVNAFGTSGGGNRGVGQAKAVIFFIVVAAISIIQLQASRRKEVQQ